LKRLVLRRFDRRGAARRASDGRGWEDFAFSGVHREADHATFRRAGFIGERRVRGVGRRNPEIAIGVQTHGDKRWRRRGPRFGWLRRGRGYAALRVQTYGQGAAREKNNHDKTCTCAEN
jgi:hypothetical protein